MKQHPVYYVLLIGFLLVTVLSACSSGSDLEVSITSPESGSVDSAVVNVEGAVSGSAETLTYTLNGGEPQTLAADGGTFAFEVTLLRGENRITVSAADGGESAEASLTLTPEVEQVEVRSFEGGLAASNPTFTRPESGDDLSDAARTNPYQVETFTVEETDLYQLRSEQDFDGYLLLYEGEFDPADAGEAVAQNDDYGGFYDPSLSPPGTSQLTVKLEPGTTYSLVTTASCNPDAPDAAGCGANTGTFANTISAGGKPPLPVVELPAPDDSRFDITLVFAQDEGTSRLTEEQRQIFEDAAERWSSVITGDIENITLDNTLPADAFLAETPPVEGTLDDVVIFVKVGNLVGGSPGSVAPVAVRPEGSASPLLPSVGVMAFDITAFEQSGFFENPQPFRGGIFHNMGHVLGIGPLWEATGNVDETYTNDNPPLTNPGIPNPDYDPGFTGEATVAEYNRLRSAAGLEPATTAPIANTGVLGNANGHWREFDFGSEVMTPYLELEMPLSRVTAASLGDLGYEVDVASDAVDQDYTLVVPEPASFEQLAPDPTVYTEYEDFAPFTGAAGEAQGAVEAVDINFTSPADTTSGCEAEDFANFAAGSVALIQRGVCPFMTKIDNAAAAGAVGVIIFNQGDDDTEARQGLIAAPNEADIPAIGVPYALGATLAGLADGALEVALSVGGEQAELSAPRGTSEKHADVLRPVATMKADGKLIPLGR